ncbi:chemotaxis protein CheB [Cupriavidus pauculus]|uniref:chemotaxis protein CheB n=1 Tax=Cupriavidus pauculus TaxID=82633 RepID=UPI0020827E09|nr:chemotaxis protein CheB [Cupriavidus pauculus]GJG97534.1 chemotaxis protein CheB [Cupriavidus pauculus]
MDTARQSCAAVVIGGSAGALEALNTLLPMLPGVGAPAVLVVVHQVPSSTSLLPELLALRCRLPVHEGEDKMMVQAGHLYVAPPDYHLLVEADPAVPGSVRLALSVEPPVRYSRPSIDVLFESAAIAWRKRMLGILLSGANDDGARGLAAIHAAGGQTWVQAPDSALVDTMPQDAITRGVADRILTPEAIGQGLACLTE